MALIDFLEIPESNVADGKQDAFELFAREFFSVAGFVVADGPDRGPDGGRDIIIEETRSGPLGEDKVRWLVSCKHKAHSGKAVLVNDEDDIPGRLEQHQCKGFIGFYSSIISSSLNNRLNSFKNRYEICLYDNIKIERELIDNPSMETLIKRFFPDSYNRVYHQIYEPVRLYNRYNPLCCDVCGKDLLQKDMIEHSGGIFVLVEKLDDSNKNNYVSAYVACKGGCDLIEKSKYSEGYITKWRDISELVIPTMFIKAEMAFINGIYNGTSSYSDEAYSKMKDIFLKSSQLVMRKTSKKEIERIQDLQDIPDWI